MAHMLSSASTSLRELRFTDNLLLDHGAESLGRFPGPYHLSMQARLIAGRAGEAIAGSSIEALVLSANGIGPAGVAALCRGLATASRLRELTISGVERGANSWMSNEVGDEGGAAIRALLERKVAHH